MATTTRQTQGQTPSVASPAEGRELFDRQARRLLGLSGEEFLRKWDAGEYRDLPDTPETRTVAYLALLIPFGRKNSYLAARRVNITGTRC